MTSQETRNAYPELVKRFDVDGRPVCGYAETVEVGFATPGGQIGLKFHPSVADAARALAAVFAAYGYLFRESAGGSINCRNITGASADQIRLQARSGRAYATSLHAHGVAVDFNPSVNRYRRAVGPIQWGRQTDMEPAMIADIEKIRTVGGFRVWTWGGRWTNIKDPMHFQATACTRLQLERGIDWSTVPETEMLMDYLKVRDLQEALNAAGASLTVDGVWGPKSAAALAAALTHNKPSAITLTGNGLTVKES